MLNLCLIGPSGCGKTTQAKLIAQKYNLTHFSIGALLRDHILQNPTSALKQFVDAGQWAPDDLVLPIVYSHLQSIKYQNFVIDGFPRVLSQGRMLEEELFKHGKPLSHIFHLIIPFTTILSRRLKAEIASNTRFSDAGRSDENDESIASRQSSYDQSILPILDYYTQKQLLTQIDATPDVDTIFTNLCTKIDQLLVSKEPSGF